MLPASGAAEDRERLGRAVWPRAAAAHDPAPGSAPLAAALGNPSGGRAAFLSVRKPLSAPATACRSAKIFRCRTAT